MALIVVVLLNVHNWGGGEARMAGDFIPSPAGMPSAHSQGAWLVCGGVALPGGLGSYDLVRERDGGTGRYMLSKFLSVISWPFHINWPVYLLAIM